MDIAPELYERILKLYKDGTALNPIIAALRKADILTYEQAYKFANLSGEALVKAFLSVLTNEVLPDGKMYFNIAEKTVVPMLETLFSDVSSICEVAQMAVNAEAEIGLRAVKPQLNSDRVYGIVNRLTDAEQFSDIAWILDAPVVNFAENVVDDSVRTNVLFHERSGLETTITRTMHGNHRCEWCAEKAGVFHGYNELPDGFFQRHDRCYCEITFKSKGGKSQNVWGSQVGQATRKTQKRLARQDRTT